MSDPNDVDYTRVMFGQNAVHVPAWMYVQDAGGGTVAFIGSSRTAMANHPLRYASERTHTFILGEVIVRPHLIVATDAHAGAGLSSLVTQVPDPVAMTRPGGSGLPIGEVLVDIAGGRYTGRG